MQKRRVFSKQSRAHGDGVVLDSLLTKKYLEL